ncbi:DeoR family transcriptional regulator [Flexivirga endophytica]|uniref:DeoR family transcriptional regulator n=1 Tax=Flexivirga endophytica TaxID=1849103 RepID=A0A916TFY3_9MICO|nr:sugar-binding domain-containing protein [Flexivirga endophytica]GGB42167.1 DeoR family transcriptional regulator [Flexivirga endophytica]GHB70368.1 DeoR family transcriptional regulator [Flexivirga endophytica]
MSESPTAGGATERERELLAAVARRFYLQDESKVDIGKELGISRFKVARLLESARAKGIVRIEILGEPSVDYALSEQLSHILGIDGVLVVRTHEGQSSGETRHDLGIVAAAELTRILTADDVLGLPWSRSVAATVGALRSLPPVPIVQLSGALAIPDLHSPVDLVRSAANLSGGVAHHFYAPLVAADPASAAMLRRQPGVSEANSHIRDVTVAVVGIGGWAPTESTLFDLATRSERTAMRKAGAIGEISGVFIDTAGHCVEGGLADRIITLSDEQLTAIPTVIGLVSGADRAPVVRAAIAGRKVNRLVVDAPLALELLR